ncbi:MAG: hypothetical protein KatS3mg015_2475 [Fimbriimonadales bacterium]|nr:MAG: hypothetical protein KatS3mg015_2475 [Fimbriimonadales bacterium]
MTLDWDEVSGRGDARQRFRIYRLCQCPLCGGERAVDGVRCPECQGEGRARQLLATVATEEAVGTAIVTLGREGEFEDCPVGVLDTLGEPGKRWIIKPWLPSPRNVSDAARTLASAKQGRR